MLYAYICHAHILTCMVLQSTKSISDICMYTGLGLTILHGRSSQELMTLSQQPLVGCLLLFIQGWVGPFEFPLEIALNLGEMES